MQNVTKEVGFIVHYEDTGRSEFIKGLYANAEAVVHRELSKEAEPLASRTILVYSAARYTTKKQV